MSEMLSALRGVLTQAWRCGLIDAGTYRRAADARTCDRRDESAMHRAVHSLTIRARAAA